MNTEKEPSYSKECCSSSKMKADTLIKISILSAIAFIIMMLDFPLPIFPAFLQIDLSDIPAIIGGFAIGPLAGVAIELIKNLIHLLTSSTAGIGEMANFIVGAVFVYVASVIYRKSKSIKSATIGVAAGTIVMSLVACIFNYYVLIPLYESALGIPISGVIEMASQVTSLITNLETVILYSILPFNLLKGVVVSAVVLLIYKKVEPIVAPKCR
ncbi:ECF transporter S component [Clostridium sp.]|uniref:ECF transporter S component n=1 Tax=Clostridium sp. TaxID=1506 RepID=UPI002FCA98EE